MFILMKIIGECEDAQISPIKVYDSAYAASVRMREKVHAQSMAFGMRRIITEMMNDWRDAYRASHNNSLDEGFHSSFNMEYEKLCEKFGLTKEMRESINDDNYAFFYIEECELEVFERD
ncbi:hypothetical protein UFOVP1290_182 [uncultured Caudovirales phage]|uniref:Uncharacterized protein n=1 Tax=uncultured Caudovirales phage TaxID=2100421 RepID=A0A6J5RKS3_9CAUD|nr:hypothetical protein UFOVP1290_182 [uncultured Caudovirales phage]